MILTSVILAVINRGRVQSAVYEQARRYVCIASLLLGIHNVIQFIGHFREDSYTLCWTINLFFYVAITPLYNMGELCLLRAGLSMRRRMWLSVCFWVLCYGIFAVGYVTGTLINDAAPWHTATFVVAICYSLLIFDITFVLHRDMKVADARLNDEELSDRHQALRYTAHSMRWVILFSFATPWIGMIPSLPINSVFGMVMFVLLIWFCIQFALYGRDIAEVIGVNDELTEANMMEAERGEAASHTCSAEQSEKPDDVPDTPDDVKARIELWVAARHYTNPNITIKDALDQMAVSATALNFYLERYTSVCGYRRWLPYLRVEEAKRFMLKHPDYSLQAVAEACGYAAKSSLSHAFKAQEGMPPAEWLLHQQKAT